MAATRCQTAGAHPRVRELVYLYGIAPSAVAVRRGLTGVGDPPRRVRLIKHGQIAAVTSAVPAGRPVGTPSDLRAHASVLDILARDGAVLPMRFGSVLADRDAAVDALLRPYHDQFSDRLSAVAGLDQFTVKGRYAGDSALRRALRAEPEAMRLRGMLRGDDSPAHQAHRIRLGELVARGLDRVRTADTQALIGALAPHATAVTEPAAAGPGSGIHAAFLVARSHTAAFERAAEELAGHWHGRVTLRLVGPTAPYDFADPAAAGG